MNCLSTFHIMHILNCKPKINDEAGTSQIVLDLFSRRGGEGEGKLEKL
jgi:hypothetical protein